MNQATITPEQAELDKANLPQVFRDRLTHHAGFLYSSRQIKTFDHTPEERQALFEELWEMVKLSKTPISSPPKPPESSFSLSPPKKHIHPN